MNEGLTVQMLSALAITLGLLGVAIFLMRRMQGRLSGSEAGGVPLRLLRRVSLGPKHGVALLRVADRILVVSIGEGGMHLLTELSPSDLEDSEPPEPHKKPRFTLRFPLIGRIFMIAALLFVPVQAWAQAALPDSTASATPTTMTAASMPTQIDVRIGQGDDELHLSGAVGLVVFLGAMTLLPALFLMMTSFTRILIILHFVRSALGTQTTPPGQLLAALGILLTGVVMNPVLQEANQTALQPYLQGQISQVEAYQLGVGPFRTFMLEQTRDQDLALFTKLSGVQDVETLDEVPTVTIVSAFITSELRTAFQMGFVIFLPFVVLDVIVASVLMSLGMFMLPPPMISLPFKLLLFVLADGWTLIVQNLVSSFR